MMSLQRKTSQNFSSGNGRDSFFRERHFFALTCFLLLILILSSSCKPTPSLPTSNKATSGEALDSEKESLNFLTHSGFLPASVIDIFSLETGIPVTVQVCDSDAQMQNFFAQSPEFYDILEPGEALAAKWMQEKKLFPLSEETIPNLQNLDSCFPNTSPDPSHRYTVPYLAGIMGILYNSEQVKGNIKSYDDIFTQQYAGRIAIPNDNREIIACALAQLGISFHNLSLSNLDDVRKELARWIPLVGKYNPRIPQQALLRRGEAVAAIARSGEAFSLTQEDSKFKWVIPSTGAHLFVENLVIPTTTPHRREAEQFINFLLRPDISAKISREYPYFNPNRAGRELLPQADRKCLCLLPQDFPKASLQTLPPLDSKFIQELSQFVEGLRSKSQ